MIPLSSSREPEQSGQYENDASVHDHEYDDCHDFDVDEEEYIVEEALLKESCKEIEHEVPPPCIELVEYMSPNPFNMIPASLTCSPPSPTHYA